MGGARTPFGAWLRVWTSREGKAGLWFWACCQFSNFKKKQRLATNLSTSSDKFIASPQKNQRTNLATSFKKATSFKCSDFFFFFFLQRPATCGNSGRCQSETVFWFSPWTQRCDRHEPSWKQKENSSAVSQFLNITELNKFTLKCRILHRNLKLSTLMTKLYKLNENSWVRV